MSRDAQNVCTIIGRLTRVENNLTVIKNQENHHSNYFLSNFDYKPLSLHVFKHNGGYKVQAAGLGCRSSCFTITETTQTFTKMRTLRLKHFLKHGG